MDIHEFLAPYQVKLKAMYDKAIAQDEDEVDHEVIMETIREELESNELVEHLGRIIGEIDGLIGWNMDCLYYSLNKEVDGVWWMIFVAWDDNEGYWTVQEGGSLPDVGQTWEEAAFALLEQYAMPGDDKSSIQMYNNILDDWRRIADKNDPLKKEGLVMHMLDRSIAQLEEKIKQVSPDAYLTDCVLTASELDDFLLSFVRRLTVR